MLLNLINLAPSRKGRGFSFKKVINMKKIIMNKKIIGILGGMGPESTAMFYQSVIQQCQKQYGAQYDEDYPEIFIYNLPIPNVVEGIKKPSKILPILIRGIKKLEYIGVDFIAIPCNTVQYFYDNLRKSISVSLLNIVEETAKKIKSENYKRVGLLATITTIENKIYERILTKFGIKTIAPEEQNKVTKIILNILAGKKLESDKLELMKIIGNMKQSGAEAIILGCTDIPALLTQKDINIELFDSIEILAEATVKYTVSK